MIPRETTREVQDILSSDKTIEDKAQAILKYHNDMLAHEYDGKVPSSQRVTIKRIKDLIIERER